MKRWLASLLLGFYSINGWAFELKVEPVADNVYAIIGEIGPRKPENHGLNNTLGFVVTDEGVVLISSGATPAGAVLLEKAVASVTTQPPPGGEYRRAGSPLDGQQLFREQRRPDQGAQAHRGEPAQADRCPSNTPDRSGW